MGAEPFSWRADPNVPAFPDEHPLIVFDESACSAPPMRASCFAMTGAAASA
ncbi:MAG TPA: hypothetical protein VD846_10030 [Allosphingosinicella sp.]|nr:hypothetical protein [Allosphingosinicella sp.]